MQKIPNEMLAAVYRQPGRLELEQVPVPTPGPDEVLLRVESCGVCGTDLKKIHYGLQSGPRIFGHETAGIVVTVGAEVKGWAPGDRAAVFHHVSCGQCFYCDRGLDSQCVTYRETAVTAGFEPAGGGFAQYVLVMERAVKRGLVRVPSDISLDQATFIEPVTTCLKGVRRLKGSPGDLLLIFGLGPIGLLIAQLAAEDGWVVLGVDPVAERRANARRIAGIDALDSGGHDLERYVEETTLGRGADAAILATPNPGAVSAAIAATRPGARVVLFANTRAGETAEIDLGAVCTGDREIVGSYSSSMNLIPEACRLIFEHLLDVDPLMTHRFELSAISEAIRLASNPQPGALKVLVHPNGVFSGSASWES